MNRRDKITKLNGFAPVVLPSLLLCDFGNLEREISRLEQAGVKALHLDVMDGQFVPNFTYGMTIVEAVRRLTDLPLDVHLMMVHPEQYVGRFFDAGADCLTIHVEAGSRDVIRSALEEIHRLGAAAGIALNPDTPLSDINPLLDACDLVLVMSVNAGFGGQSFNPVALDKLRQLRESHGRDLLLQVDGGVNRTTIARTAEAGARWFVVGSAIFNTENYQAAIAELFDLAHAA